MPFVTVLIVVAFAAPADPKMPSDFLRVDSKAWSKWLDEELSVSWGGVPLKDALAEQFGPADFTVDNPKVLDTPIRFDADGMSRRAALWHLSQRYGFTIRWAQKGEPKTFLGLSEAEHRDHTVGGRTMTEITHVMRSEYKDYQDLKRRGQVNREEVIDGVLYYATNTDRDVHFPNGAVAHVIEVQRYKTAVPRGKVRVDKK